jgi:hypothetical protein
MHARHRNLGPQRVELVLDLAVFLWDRVKPLHLDCPKHFARFRVRHFPAHADIVGGIDERKPHSQRDDATLYNEGHGSQAFDFLSMLESVGSASRRGRRLTQYLFRGFDCRIVLQLQIAQCGSDGFVGQNSRAFQLAPLRGNP